jgi:hypothetical protein
VRASTRSSFNRAAAIALHWDGCAKCGPSPCSLSNSNNQDQPNAASNPTGVPAGRPLSSFDNSNKSLRTLRLNRWVPSDSTTAT